MLTQAIRDRRERRNQQKIELAEAKQKAIASLLSVQRALDASTVSHLEILSSNQRFISANLNNMGQDLVALRVQVNSWCDNFSKISKDIERLGCVRDWTERTELELQSIRAEVQYMQSFYAKKASTISNNITSEVHKDDGAVSPQFTRSQSS